MSVRTQVESTTVPGTQVIPMINGRTWTFTHNGWEYRMVSANGSDSVRLFYRTTPTGRWANVDAWALNGHGAACVAREVHAIVTDGRVC